jgi:hypothetical protein
VSGAVGGGEDPDPLAGQLALRERDPHSDPGQVSLSVTVSFEVGLADPLSS